MITSNDKANVICLMGPTASDKTKMAVELVKRRPFQIISVDSAQVYRGMDIGSGKPDERTLTIAPHRLIDIQDPSHPYSASEFREDVMAEIKAVLNEGDIPLLVGGSMLYFKVLRDGLADMPNADPQVRQEIEALAQKEGWETVHQKLASVDHESAARIHPNDPQRLQRALEVFLLSGKSMTELHIEKQQSRELSNPSLPVNLNFFAIQPLVRGALYKKIEQRFFTMLKKGLVEEVQKLYQRADLHPLLPSIKSVGYRQVWEYLDGGLDYDAMVEKSIIATRQLAKRQLTWLRSWDNLRGLSDSSAKSIEIVLNYVDSVSI